MSGTTPPSVDQIQSQQIATLSSQVAALQAASGSTAQLQAEIDKLNSTVSAMQTTIDGLSSSVTDIQNQLQNGPPNFGTWPITGVAGVVEDVNQLLADIVHTGQGTG